MRVLRLVPARRDSLRMTELRLRFVLSHISSAAADEMWVPVIRAESREVG
jgi:hypothetical protein